MSGDPEDFEPSSPATHNWMDSLAYIFLCTAWLAGFVVAKGFWSTVFCIIPFWAWYLVIEKILQSIGWV